MKANIVNLLKRRLYIFTNFFKVIGVLSNKNKKKLNKIFFLMIINGILESITLTSVIPFISVLLSPERIYKIIIFKNLFSYIGLNSAQEIVLPVCIFFIIFIILASIIKIYYLWESSQLVGNIGCDLGIKTYKNLLFKNYEEQLLSNSSEPVTIISKYIFDSVNVINAYLQVVIAILISLFLIIVLLFINPSSTISSFLFLVFSIY